MDRIFPALSRWLLKYHKGSGCRDTGNNLQALSTLATPSSREVSKSKNEHRNIRQTFFTRLQCNQITDITLKIQAFICYFPPKNPKAQNNLIGPLTQKKDKRKNSLIGVYKLRKAGRNTKQNVVLGLFGTVAETTQ